MLPRIVPVCVLGILLGPPLDGVMAEVPGRPRWGESSGQSPMPSADGLENSGRRPAPQVAPLPGQQGASRIPNNPRLTEDVRRVLNDYYQRPFNTRDYGPWSVLHWSIAYGVDARVRVGGPSGEVVAAIRWLCDNEPAAGKRLITQHGDQLSLPIAPGVQGHHGQFLSMLAQSGVSSDFAIRVDDRELTVADLVDHEKHTCQSGEELTFKLIGLAAYTSSNEVWQNSDGESWSVGRLLLEELRQPVNRYASCCGGTHRLFAWDFAVQCRRQEGLAIDGPWQTAAQRIDAYQRRAFQLQNRDGSFSTAWLDRVESQGDKTRRLTTSGHVLEWLAFSLPAERLADPRFERAVQYVVNLLEENNQHDWHPGALGHALHGLAIYLGRIDGRPQFQHNEGLADLGGSAKGR